MSKITQHAEPSYTQYKFNMRRYNVFEQLFYLFTHSKNFKCPMCGQDSQQVGSIGIDITCNRSHVVTVWAICGHQLTRKQLVKAVERNIKEVPLVERVYHLRPTRVVNDIEKQAGQKFLCGKCNQQLMFSKFEIRFGTDFMYLYITVTGWCGHEQTSAYLAAMAGITI